MSAYITLTDLKKRIAESKLIQLTDFESAGTINEARVTQAIAESSAMLDSYCASRYALPLTASDQIKDVCLRICIYKLFMLRQGASEIVRTEYEDAIAFLKDVAAGKATLDQAAVAQAVSSVGVVTRDHTTDPERFDDLNLADWY